MCGFIASFILINKWQLCDKGKLSPFLLFWQVRLVGIQQVELSLDNWYSAIVHKFTRIFPVFVTYKLMYKTIHVNLCKKFNKSISFLLLLLLVPLKHFSLKSRTFWLGQINDRTSWPNINFSRVKKNELSFLMIKRSLKTMED